VNGLAEVEKPGGIHL